MLRRLPLAPLLTAALAALCIAAPGAAHPGHGLPHPFHHVDPLLGLLSVAGIAAVVAWGIARSRRSARPALRAAGAALAAAGAWLLLV